MEVNKEAPVTVLWSRRVISRKDNKGKDFSDPGRFGPRVDLVPLIVSKHPEKFIVR